MRARAIAMMVASVSFVAAACGDGGETELGGDPARLSVAPTSSSAPPTTGVPATTEAAPTTAPAPTAAPATAPIITAPVGPTTAMTSTVPTPSSTDPAVLVLRSDGIGAIGFGTAEADTLAALEPALGAVSSEIRSTYPNDLGDGTFLDESNVDAFAYRAQRTACFDNALCLVFGGDAPESLAFVGWSQNNQGIHAPLATDRGVTAGSIWADHIDDLAVEEFGCYVIGYATTDGIAVSLSSAGEPFTAYDADGNPIATHPDPADVSVIELSAGTHPYFPGDDC